MQNYNWSRKLCSSNFNKDVDILGDDISYGKAYVALVELLGFGSKLVGKKILFVGDSHTRGLANIFMYYACGYEFESIMLDESNVKVGKKGDPS